MAHKFSAVYEQDGSWWVGYVEELPGANTQGTTFDEARENLKEAVALILGANREQSRSATIGRSVIREPLDVTTRCNDMRIVGGTSSATRGGCWRLLARLSAPVRRRCSRGRRRC